MSPRFASLLGTQTQSRVTTLIATNGRHLFLNRLLCSEF